MSRLPVSGYRMPHPALGDAALVALAVAAVWLAFVVTAQSIAAATSAVLAVATAAAMHARFAMGRWRAAGQVCLCALVLSLAGAPPRLVGTVLITGLAAGELVARCTRRSAVLRAGAWTALVAGVASLSGLAAAEIVPAGQVAREGLGALAGALLGAPIMLAVGPMLEWLFGHTTRLTMSEWLGYEQPLLRELATAAPGTFQHSVNVGVLADAAAGAIGADALLARVGGLYHDVGKIRAPEFFAENQNGSNPHDRLDPRESARILRAHVTDGVDLVRAHRMGHRIADFVREHHGTGSMRGLRDKAEAAGLAADEETYRYPGPKPRSAETGIVMIADQLEATAATEPPADEDQCHQMVRRTIERIAGEHELDDSGLAPRDLDRIRPALGRALAAMYRRRVTEPRTPSPQAPPSSFVARVFARGRRGL